MKALLQDLRLFFTTIRYSLGSSKLPRRFMHKNVSYFSQWESRGLVGEILSGSVKAEDDPKWRDSGAATKAEYAAWSWSGCGMACFKMILAHRSKISVPLVALGKACCHYGGYDMPLERSQGLKYAPFVKFAKNDFGITASAKAALPIIQIASELSRTRYVIASVHPSIRDATSKPKTKGGHLILVLGYDLDRQLLYLHNPSGNSPTSQEYVAISFKNFEKFFSYRGIIIS